MSERTQTWTEKLASFANKSWETAKETLGAFVNRFRGKTRTAALTAVALSGGACADPVCDARASRAYDNFDAEYMDPYGMLSVISDYVYGEAGTPDLVNSRRQKMCQLRENEEYHMVRMATPTLWYFDPTSSEDELVYSAAGQAFRLVRRDDPNWGTINDHDNNPDGDRARRDITGMGIPNGLMDLSRIGRIPDGISDHLYDVDLTFGGMDSYSASALGAAASEYLDPTVSPDAHVWAIVHFDNGAVEPIEPEDMSFWFLGDRGTIVYDGDFEPAHRLTLPEDGKLQAVAF